jgi:glycosyltransferase involved in cell wall biosynthesis
MEPKKEIKTIKVSMEFPLVSVLMTAYNREKYIIEAIESVLSSTYTNFELIIVDDGSADNTVNIARGFAQKDDRIKVYVNPKNLGDYANRNNAAKKAKGEYLMYVDSDDRIFPDGISNCVGAMQRFPGSSFGMFWRAGSGEPFVMSPGEAIRRHFFESPFLLIGPGGTVLRRSFFERIGGYPEKYGPANDMYFNLKAACAEPLVLLPFEFMYYRQHEGQQINNPYGYMVHGYQYMRDVLVEVPLPLTAAEIEWIGKKNKRRFVTNITSYFFRSFNLPKTRHAVAQTGFRLQDLLQGVFH